MSDVGPYDLAYLQQKLKGELTEVEYKAVRQMLDDAIRSIIRPSFRGKHQAPAFHEFYHRERVRFYGETPFIAQQNRLILAHKRDLTEQLHVHITERRKYAGNVVLEFGGPTGYGKSSSMLGLMERHNGLRDIVLADGVDGLRRHMSIDLAELPSKLEGLTGGQAIAIDEQLRLYGEGAETNTKMLQNIEDTLRGTQIDLFFASPGRRDNHDASQGYLEAYSASPVTLRNGQPGSKSTRFLYWYSLAGQDLMPLGYVDLPWCSAEVFEAYSTIKRENLDRTRRAQFTNAAALNVEIIKRIVEHPAFQARLKHNLRPTKGDMEKYVGLYAGTSINTGQQKALAGELEEMLNVIRDSPPDFATIWGFEPTEAMLKLAGRKDTGVRRL